ncbi:MAG: exo-alpha-sialidase [Candidatus Solibacter sp.]|jgi:sialidase-1|nr:exo-alpha-sialidase [Candidatus Solibacter sp.]
MCSRIGFFVAFAALAAEPVIDRQVLFERGKGDYVFYRIPGIVVTKAGTVLAYAEARRTTRGDWGATDLLVRRSADAGKTFSDPAVVGKMSEDFPKNPAAVAKKQGLGEGAGVTYDNPVAIADRKGAVHFVFCVEYMRVFYMRSDDDGRTFSKPVEITAAVEPLRKAFPWVVVATGPGHGIQLKNGRLLVPIWLSLGSGASAHGDSVVSTLYSDDLGRTWKSGEIAAPKNSETVSPNETAAVQLADGRVMLNVRSPSKEQRRLVVFSKDGATHWSAPVFEEQLPEPLCFASMVRLSLKKNRLLFVNPDNLARADGKNTPGMARDRKNVTVRLSYDEGKSWPVKRSLEPGPSAYSDLAVLPDGTILCFYEAGTKTPYDTLTLARFNLEWLTNGQDSLSRKKN